MAEQKPAFTVSAEIHMSEEFVGMYQGGERERVVEILQSMAGDYFRHQLKALDKKAAV
jgi:hypothetical protein